jgi:hypothetical protein
VIVVFESIGDECNAVLDGDHVEVDEQAATYIGEAEIALISMIALSSTTSSAGRPVSLRTAS